MIGSYSAILIRKCEGDDPAIKEYSDFIMDGVSHMQALINGLLDYSRVGRKDIRFEKVDTREMIDNVQAALGSLIESANATIEVKNAPVIAGVPSLVATLLQNLIANGIKFKRDNTIPHIVIDAVPATNRRQWVFSVEDNGIGIPKQYYNRIFALFQRLHTRQQYEGTGIGLAISKRIVEFHRGELWVESDMDKGSTFYFTLPVVEMLDSGEILNATHNPAIAAVEKE
jgi:light-regulated signal transduction histidine kinase (bacteriophytochrome)